jgi:hypothetical protein
VNAELFPELALAPPPYPSDVQAKGWRFELDYEQIEQSDTVALAIALAMQEGKPLGRALLLNMWYAAWKSTPCGSLPANDQLLAAAMQIPPALVADYRAVLLRGWWEAADGRLYHPTLTTRVLEMVEYRRKNAERVAGFKARQCEQRDGNALPTRKVRGRNDTGTGTSNTPLTPQRGKSTLPLQDWLDSVKAAGEKPIAEDDPIFAYSSKAKIPDDFLRLAWLEFRHQYTQPGAKSYKDWRAHFRNAVRRNWLRLWWVDRDGNYALTASGAQARITHAEADE